MSVYGCWNTVLVSLSRHLEYRQLTGAVRCGSSRPSWSDDSWCWCAAIWNYYSSPTVAKSYSMPYHIPPTAPYHNVSTVTISYSLPKSTVPDPSVPYRTCCGMGMMRVILTAGCGEEAPATNDTVYTWIWVDHSYIFQLLILIFVFFNAVRRRNYQIELLHILKNLRNTFQFEF